MKMLSTPLYTLSIKSGVISVVVTTYPEIITILLFLVCLKNDEAK